MDHVTKEIRSRIMAAVRSKNNRTTELLFSKYLWSNGFRGYRKHYSVLGRPDFAWPTLKVAVFIDGCFWHGCTCKNLPKSNKAFWGNKIARNKLRDGYVSRVLRKNGWSVIRIKECRLLNPGGLLRISKAIAKRKASMGSPNRNTKTT